MKISVFLHDLNIIFLQFFNTEIGSFYIDNNLLIHNEEEPNYGPFGIPHVAYDYPENYHNEDKEKLEEIEPFDPYFQYEVISTKLLNTKFTNQLTSFENSESSDSPNPKIDKTEKSEEIVPIENLVNSMTDLGVSVISDIINDTNDFVSIISDNVDSFNLATENYYDVADYDMEESPFVDYDFEDFQDMPAAESFEDIDNLTDTISEKPVSLEKNITLSVLEDVPVTNSFEENDENLSVPIIENVTITITFEENEANLSVPITESVPINISFEENDENLSVPILENVPTTNSFEIIKENLSVPILEDDPTANSFELIEENLSVTVNDEYEEKVPQRDSQETTDTSNTEKIVDIDESDSTTEKNPQYTTTDHEELIRIKKDNGNEAEYYNDDYYYYYSDETKGQSTDEIEEQDRLPFSKDIEENFSSIPGYKDPKMTPNTLLSELDNEKTKCSCDNRQEHVEHDNRAKDTIKDRIQDKRAVISVPKRNKFQPLKRPFQPIQRPSPKPLFSLFKPAQTSEERAEKIHDNIQRIMRFVNIFSQIDSFIQDKTKKSIKRLAKMYEKDDEDREGSF